MSGRDLARSEASRWRHRACGLDPKLHIFRGSAKKNEKFQLKPQIKKNQTISVNKNSKKLINKELSKYLSFISSEINKLATKSYPMQSIRRREQGTIVAFITINSKGNLQEIEFDKKTPTRLFKATKKIIINFNFPKPPTMILDKNKTIKIKIPVNFILR